MVLNATASMGSPLTPGEDEQARTIARQMITPMINPSADAIQLGYDCLLRTKYVGHERVSLALIELLDDPAPLTRLAAAVTLLQKGNGRHQACAAIDLVLKTCDVTLKIAAASLLSILEELPDELLATLKQLLEEEHRNLRIAVAAIMKDSPKSLPILSQALWDDNHGLAFMAAKGLIRRRIRVDDAMNSLISWLGKVSDEWDAAIVGQLSELPEKADHISPTLVRLLTDPKTSRMTRTVAAGVLGKIGHSAKAQAEFERALFASLRSGNWETVCTASTALQDLGVAPRKVIRALEELLASSIMDARGMAAVILGEFGTRAADAVPALFEQVGVERNSDVLIALRFAIHSIGLPDDSPLIPSAKPDITPEPVVSKITGLDDSGSFIRTIVTTLATDPAFRSVVVTFLDVSPEEREAMRRSIRFWLGYLTGVERGKVVKGYKDDLDDGEVADVAMVARETLSRDETYQTFKCLMSANPLPAVKRRGRNGHRFDIFDQRTAPRRRANHSKKSRRSD